MKKELKLKGIATVTALSLMFSIAPTGEVVKAASPNQYVSTETTNPHDYRASSSNKKASTEEEQQEEYKNTLQDYFTDLKEELKELIDQEDFNGYKAKAKGAVVTFIDFVFFDQPIKGVYFKDLSADLKKYTIYNIESAAEQIEEWFPGLLDNLGQKYQTASLFLKEKYLDVLDKIKSYLGEEDWNALLDIKDKLRETFSDKTNDVIDYLTKKYLNWRNR